MRFSTKSRYALRAVVDLASHSNGRPISIPEICQRQGLSSDYIEQLFIRLKKAGLLKSVRGSQGGYLLTKPAGSITVGDIIRTVERPLTPVICLDREGEGIKECSRSKECLTKSFWEKVNEKIGEVLDSTTLEDLAKGGDGC